MRNAIRFVFVLALAGGLAAGASRVPGLLAELEIFRVRDIRVEGTRFLVRDEAVEWAAIPDGASVWDDPGRWESQLRAHPLVRDVRVRKRLPGTLVLQVRERKPVALIPDPVLEPVDARGRPLPLDPAGRRLDLPVIRPTRRRDEQRLTPREVQAVAREIGRLEEIDPRFVASISDVELGARNHLIARLTDSGVELHFRPPLTSHRLREGLRALSDAAGRGGGVEPRSVDLRYDDQVVVRLPPGSHGSLSE